MVYIAILFPLYSMVLLWFARRRGKHPSPWLSWLPCFALFAFAAVDGATARQPNGPGLPVMALVLVALIACSAVWNQLQRRGFDMSRGGFADILTTLLYPASLLLMVLVWRWLESAAGAAPTW
jgi:hypothetical protein